MHRSSRAPITRVVVVLCLAAASTHPLPAQNPLGAIRRAAEDARKKAEATQRRADSVQRAVDSTKRAVARAQAQADSAKTAVEGAARTLTTPAASAPLSSAPVSAVPPPTTPSTAGASPAGTTARPGGPGTSAPTPARSAPNAASPRAQASDGATRAQGGGAKVEAQLMVAGEPGLAFEVSPKGQHVAAVVLRGSRTVVVYDGVDGPRFDEIANLPSGSGKIAFSEDGSRWAYIGRVGHEWVVMLDGKELIRGAPWAQSNSARTITQLGFTPGGKHIWFTTTSLTPQRTEHRLYIDGVPGPVSEDHITPVFSPNGERHAYNIPINPRTANPSTGLVVDGKLMPYTGGDPQFTTDGEYLFTKILVPRSDATDILLDGKPFMRVASAQLHMAPVGPGVIGVVWTPFQNGNRFAFLTIGNQRVPKSECGGNAGFDRVFFSPDAKHWAARCQDATGAYWMMVDGKRGPDYQSVNVPVVFTADGRAVYQATMNGKTFLVVGEEESDAFVNIRADWRYTRPRVGETPENPPAIVHGNRIGYVGVRQLGAGNHTAVVVDNKAMMVAAAHSLTFSPDGSRFGALVGHPYAQLSVDGAPPFAAGFAPEAASPRPYLRSYVFSPDGKHVAWASFPKVNDHRRAIAINGKLFLTDATMHHNITFTPDGRHLMWIGNASGAPRMRLYVDGEAVLEFDSTLGIVNDAEAYWSMGPDGVLTFIAQHEGAIKRFRVTPGNGSVEAMLAKAVNP